MTDLHTQVGPLVATEWAQEHLDDPGVTVVEVDEDSSTYQRSHIPGAVALDWRADLQDPVRRTFVNGSRFAQLLDERGIARETQVLLYGGNNKWFAGYAYWYFRLYGHERVSLIDGGRIAWEAEGRPLTDRPTQVIPTTGYQTSDPNPTLRARRDEILERYVGARGTGLIDVRSPAEFEGEVLAPGHLPSEAAQVPGHIPGAANVPWGTAVDPETGRFLPVDQLTAIYADKGVTADRDVSRTAGSASAATTPGSSYTNSLATSASRTTTALGRSTARWSTFPSNLDREKLPPRTTCGPATSCTALPSAVGKRCSSRSSTTTRG